MLRLPRLLILIAAATGTCAVLIGGMPVASAVAVAGSSAGCGPTQGKTLISGRLIRVYTVSKIDHRGRRNVEVPLVFGCTNPHGYPRLLGSASSGLAVYRRKRIGQVHTETLTDQAPWVAYPLTVSGIDTWTLTVVSVNLRTNTRRYCRVGGTIAPRPGPTVSDIAVAPHGSVAWSGESNSDSNSILGPLVPKVVACDSTGYRTLDEGEGIDLHSLALDGSLLSWSDSGVKHFAVLR